MENKKKTEKSKTKQKSKSKTTEKSKPKPKPNNKSKTNEKSTSKQSQTQSRPKVSTKKYNSGITIIRDSDENTNIDEYYERKMNGIIKRIKDQNQLIDDKIRFGWNNS